MGHAQTHNVFGRQRFNGFAIKQDLAAHFDHLAQGAQGGGFACAVGAQQRGDAAFFDLHRQAMNHFGGAIAGVQVFHFQQNTAHAADPK